MEPELALAGSPQPGHGNPQPTRSRTTSVSAEGTLIRSIETTALIQHT